MINDLIKDKAILLFDGNCGLCNRSVKLILRKEKNHDLFFCALQSDIGKEILKHFELEDNADTMVLIKNGKAYLRSGAALRVTGYMKGLWPLMMGFLIIPAFLRNDVYDYVAAQRITWYGTADYCEMMTPELRHRFLGGV